MTKDQFLKILNSYFRKLIMALFGKKIFSSDPDTTPPSGSAPSNTSAPVITGIAQEGRELSCSTGAWLGVPAPTFTFQWYHSDDEAISGADESTYTLTNNEISIAVYCKVTATNSSGSASADSADSATVVTATPNAPTGLTLTAIDGGFSAIWTEPADNGYAVTSYTVEYKKTAAPSYTQYVVNTVEGNLPEAATITGLDAEEYTVRVFATNAIRDGSPTSTLTVTPLVNQTVQSAIPLVGGKGLVAYWSAKQHDGNTTWENLITSPADGSAQSVYNITQSGTAPTWDGQKFVMNNSARWNGANTAFMNSLHQTSAGNEWTWFALAKTAGTLSLDSMFGTADADTDTGISIRVDSGGKLKLDQRTGTRVTSERTLAVSAATLYKLAIKRNQDTGQTFFAANEDTFEAKTHTYATNTLPATYNFCVGSEGNNGNPMDTSTELYAMGIINRAITDAELAALNDALDTEFTPPAPTAPEQVDSVQATGADGQIQVAWRLTDTGGVDASAVTYQVEYKASSSGTWLNFGSPISTPYANITGLTNSTAYDVRISAINIAGTGTVSATKSATPVVAGTAPYDLQYYKTTLPVTSAGSRFGSAAEIVQPAFLTYTGPWFGRGTGYIDFFCPDGGATTATATYCRSELRHLTNFSYSLSCEDTLKFAVMSIPDGGKTIVHQIHGIDNPWVKVQVIGKNDGTGRVEALVKQTYGAGDTKYTLLSNYVNGTQVVSRIVYTYFGSNTGQLQFYINGSLVATSTLNRSATDGDLGLAYWKRGNYFQDISRAGNICQVRHYTQSGQFVP